MVSIPCQQAGDHPGQLTELPRRGHPLPGSLTCGPSMKCKLPEGEEGAGGRGLGQQGGELLKGLGGDRWYPWRIGTTL